MWNRRSPSSFSTVGCAQMREAPPQPPKHPCWDWRGGRQPSHARARSEGRLTVQIERARPRSSAGHGVAGALRPHPSDWTFYRELLLRGRIPMAPIGGDQRIELTRDQERCGYPDRARLGGNPQPTWPAHSARRC